MKSYKMQDSAGKRFTVYANDRAEAKAKAQKMTTAKVFYFAD